MDDNGSFPSQNTSEVPGAGGGADSLKKLRSALESAQQLGAIENLVEAVSGSFDQLVAENDAMANELLTVYEQLGVVFDVSSKLAVSRSEEEILETFTSSLKRSFASRGLCIATRSDDGVWRLDTDDTAVTSWLYEKLDAVGSRGSATVQEPPSGAIQGEVAEVMVAPVLVGKTPVCAVVMYRAKDESAFHASEKMLIESLALFCGDVIRNFRLVRELREMSASMVRSLVSAVDQKDPYTCGHSLRVAFYAAKLGSLLDLDYDELQMLEWAALLHDVGKIGIRDAVLNKAGKLTREEFAHIQEHPVRSHQVVRGVPQLAAALDGILYHHERYNGSGYPEGLRGEAIPFQARIIQVVDVFDALTSTRSYRGAYDWKRALDIMEQEAGTTLDPMLTRLFSGYLRQRLAEGPDAWEKLFAEANASLSLLGHGAVLEEAAR